MLKVGSILDTRYKIVEKIGSGGMSVVYKALCKKLNRDVALKILRQEYLNNQKIITEFKGEAKAIAKISHPNIVNVYDVGSTGGLHYITMEYIDGLTLSDFIKKEGPLDNKRIIKIATQISSALMFTHKRGIIHRDIKPQNILVTKNNTVKVTDFGMAKLLNTDDEINGSVNAIGSVYYFSPEQARGSRIDKRSDLYSLGVIMYEMATGKVPFEGNSPLDIAKKHLNDDYIKVREINPNISVEIENVIDKLLRKNKEDRFYSAREVLRKLSSSTKKDFSLNFLNNNEDDEIKNENTVEDTVENNKKEVDEKRKITETKEELRAVNKVKNNKKKLKTTEKTIIKPSNDLKNYNQSFEDFIGITNEREEKVKSFLMVMGAIFVGALVLTIILTIANKIFITETPDYIVLENYAGVNFDDLKKITDDGIDPKPVNFLESEDYKKGQIISQSPEPGEKIEYDSEIDVVISKGLKTFFVNKLIGLNIDEARDFMKEKPEFNLKVEYLKTDKYKDGEIIKQYPEPGITKPKGTDIKVVVAKDPNSEENDNSNESQLVVNRENSIQIKKPKFIEDVETVAIKIIITTEEETKLLYDKEHKVSELPIDIKTDEKGMGMIYTSLDGTIIANDKFILK